MCSHAGFIVISRYLEIYILNPARPSDECVKITLPERISSTRICAVYYHPSLQQYVSLLKMVIWDSNPRQPQLVQYKLLNLGTNPSLKTITSPLSEFHKANPVYVNSFVYWMLMPEHGYRYKGDILEFDILREEFVVIRCPCPAALLNTVNSNDQTQLLNNDGVVVFVLLLPSTITIWSLENHKEHLWTSIEYTVSLRISHGSNEFRIISLANGMLAFMDDKILFVCNLKEGTVKHISKKRYSLGTMFFSHQMSLASLKNCKSKLFIDKDGELLQ